MKHLLISKIKNDAILPTRNNPTDAGLDLTAYYDRIIEPHQVSKIPTGVAVLIPTGYVGLLFPKSRNNFIIGGGVIDAGYTGEVIVKVINTLAHRIVISYGDSIAQLILIPIETPPLLEVDMESLKKAGAEMSARGDEGGINKPWDGRRGF
jgi:dUTP pyrophosphatase